jgi:hypothetical protein
VKTLLFFFLLAVALCPPVTLPVAIGCPPRPHHGAAPPRAWPRGAPPRRRSPLDLSYNVLSGDLAPLPTSTLALHAANLLRGAPPDLAVLLALIALNASNNSLSNPLKPDLYTNALTLRVLNISVNRLAGSLPSALHHRA